MKNLGVAACAALMITVPAKAETLTQYATKCAQELGLAQIPGYACSQSSSASGADFFVQSSNNRVGRVPTQNTNPNVDAVFLCRDVNNVAHTAALNGYILQNNVTGKTCFFDALPNASATVPPPTATNAGNFWRPPSQLRPPTQPECVQCHSADPFAVSLGIAQGMKSQNMMRAGRNRLGVYHVVNSEDPTSQFSGWNGMRQIVTQSCASNCHNTSNTTASQQMVSVAVANQWMAQAVYTERPPETRASIAVWRPDAEAWFHFDADWSRTWNPPVDRSGRFGTTGDKPFVLSGPNCNVAPGTQRAVFGLARGTTWMLTVNNHFHDPADDANTFTYLSGSPLSWNGVAVSYQNATFAIDYNANRSTSGDISFAFGSASDRPVIGRWKPGIGHRIGTFRAVNGLGWWYLDTNGNNGWQAAADTASQFGDATDLPFVGDFNGDGIDEIGVFRNGSWFVDMNNNFVWNGTAGGDAEWSFGGAGDIPVVTPSKWDCQW